ncbi:hypothetical protein HPB52_005248 [Rhipicephalus sanguineus]|uniref:Uncharacterized protein n=1 Tax=Rhipicephalus sanguineus TaxID=34632 RepID=A0A9D4PF83_RHISA|nr:hypothetical protein HPB52_005248 [Rhipicephalus sanguineus]
MQEELSFPGMNTPSNRRHRQGMCNTTGCVWLHEYLSPGRHSSGSGHIHSQSQRGGRPGPCDDFYVHVCGSRRHSLYRDGAARLMVAVAERITGRLRAVAGSGSRRVEVSGTGDPEEDHAVVLDRCLEGGAVVTKNLIVRVAPGLHTGGRLNIDDVRPVKAFRRRWITTACRWVELSARCHLERSLRLRNYGDLSLYQRLWKLLYFAPFLGSPARPLVKAAYQEPPDPQLQACLRIIDDVFRQKAAEAAKATLSEAVDELHDTVTHFVWEARQASVHRLVPR